MRIQHYKFGQITINGQTFASDVVIFPDRVEKNWWRSDGHRLIPSDLPSLPEEKPEILVIGQGIYGCMEISEVFIKYVKDLHIELLAGRTDHAIEIYNNKWSMGNRKLIAAIHLTC
jgi:hypothetical protein